MKQTKLCSYKGKTTDSAQLVIQVTFEENKFTFSGFPTDLIMLTLFEISEIVLQDNLVKLKIPSLEKSLIYISWIRQAFEQADRNKDMRLDFEEVMKLLKTLNADMDRMYVKEMFNVSE